MTEAYGSTANELVERIKALVPDNPHILNMQNPFDLFDIEGFVHSDLQPSMFQASWALQKAKQEYVEEHN